MVQDPKNSAHYHCWQLPPQGTTTPVIPSVNAASLIDPWNSPYAYFTSVQGNDYHKVDAQSAIPSPGVLYIPATNTTLS